MAALTIIGIDPGSRRTGWGVLKDSSSHLEMLACGIIQSPGADDDFSARLARIYQELALVLERYQPDEAAIEQVFTARNAASALKLGQARGVAVAACAARGIPVSDYPPTLVKQSLVGNGRAEKEQVAFMVGRLLNLTGQRLAALPLDSSDALAVGICHLSGRRLAALTKRQA